VKSAIKQEDYPDAEIIDIVPSADLGKLVSGTLNFDKQDKAVKKYFAELEGKRYIKTLFEKDETYIEIQDSLARLDFEAAKKKAEYETKYDQLSNSVNRNFDYINKLEESLKKLDK
jgi:NTE family protein